MTTQTQEKTDIRKLLELSEELKMDKHDHEYPASEFEFTDEALLTVPDTAMGAVHPLDLTLHAWTQMCAKLGNTVNLNSLPVNYLMELDKEVTAGLMNMHLQGSDKTFKVRAYQNSGRAVLSDRYGDLLDNTELLQMLTDIDDNETNSGKMTRYCSLTPDDLNVRIVWKTVDAPNGGRDGGKKAPWGIGVGISNNETGLRKLRVHPLIKRGSCDNSIMGNPDVNALAISHVGTRETTLAAKRVQIKSAIINAIPSAMNLLSAMIEAEERDMPNISDVIYLLAKERGWDEKTKERVMIGTEGSHTHAGLVNGITWAAHEVVDPTERYDMEVFGGAILLDDDSVFTRALANAERIDR